MSFRLWLLLVASWGILAGSHPTSPTQVQFFNAYYACPPIVMAIGRQTTEPVPFLQWSTPLILPTTHSTNATFFVPNEPSPLHSLAGVPSRLLVLWGPPAHPAVLALPPAAAVSLPALRALNFAPGTWSLGPADAPWWRTLPYEQPTAFFPLAHGPVVIAITSTGADVLPPTTLTPQPHTAYTAFLLPTPWGIRCFVEADPPLSAEASAMQPAPEARVLRLRFLNAVSTMATIDVLVGGQPLATRLPLGMHTFYTPVSTDQLRVEVFGSPTPEAPLARLLDTSLQCPANFSTATLWADINGTVGTGAVLTDHAAHASQDNRTRVRFLSLCPACPPLALTLNGHHLIPPAHPDTPSDYHFAAPGSFSACVVSGPGEVFACRDSIPLEAQKAYTVVALGLPNVIGPTQLRLVVMTDGPSPPSKAGLTWGALAVLLVVLTAGGGAACTLLECTPKPRRKRVYREPTPLSWHHYGTDMDPVDRDTVVRFKNTPTVYCPLSFPNTPTTRALPPQDRSPPGPSDSRTTLTAEGPCPLAPPG